RRNCTALKSTASSAKPPRRWENRASSRQTRKRTARRSTTEDDVVRWKTEAVSRVVGRLGVLVLLTLGLLNSGPRGVWASEPAGSAQRWLNPAVGRPHLDVAPAPQPTGIHLPGPVTSQLLLTKRPLDVPEGLRLMIFAPHPDDE